MDKHVSVPGVSHRCWLFDVLEPFVFSLALSLQVRCPFLGCSEFLHRVNTAPFEDFLLHFSNHQMESYCQPVGKTWTDCISPSYPKTVEILYKFPCEPCIVLNDDGPMILLCRNHSTKSKDSYLHVPESATGNIYTPNANAFAPVVIRPRTNRNYKVSVTAGTSPAENGSM